MAVPEGRIITGVLFIIVGMLIGIIYPFLLVYLDTQHAVELMRYTFVAVSIAIGAFLGAVGAIMLRGYKPSESAEDTS